MTEMAFFMHADRKHGLVCETGEKRARFRETCRSVAKLSKPSFQIMRRASLFAPSVHVNACTVMPFA